MFGHLRKYTARFIAALLTFTVGIAVTFLFVLPRKDRPALVPTPPPTQTREEVQSERKGLRLEPVAHGIKRVALLGNSEIWGIPFVENDRQKMFFSSDGGTNWERKEFKTDVDRLLDDITFVDSQHGWATGSFGTILRTADGGKTWKLLKGPDFNLNVVQFVNAKMGYIAAQKSVAMPIVEIHRTDDSGRSWRRCYREEGVEFTLAVFRIATLGENIAVAVVGGTHLVRTENAGRTWKRVGLNITTASTVMFDHNGVGWVVSPKGSFYRSFDRGKTWEGLRDLPPGMLNRYWWDIDFMDSKTGVAVGKDGALAVTHDGGSTWVEQNIGTDDSLGIIHLRDGGGIVLGLQNVYRLSIE